MPQPFPTPSFRGNTLVMKFTKLNLLNLNNRIRGNYASKTRRKKQLKFLCTDMPENKSASHRNSQSLEATGISTGSEIGQIIVYSHNAFLHSNQNKLAIRTVSWILLVHCQVDGQQWLRGHTCYIYVLETQIILETVIY